MAATVELANFAAGIGGVSGAARDHAVKAVLDLVASATAGAGTAPAAGAVRAARQTWGRGPASIWFGGGAATAAGAACVNAVFASALDLDDGHRGAAGHPGAGVIPAAIATAQAHGGTADRLLGAIVVGYEVGVRIAAARDFDTFRTTDSGLWSGYGAASASAWLRGLAPIPFAHALAIAGTLGPGLPAAGRSPATHTIKEGIPWACASGLAAVDLAVAGHEGPLDVLDVDDVFDTARIIERLGDAWRIEGVYYKRYSCCRWAHAAIDAALELQAGRARPAEAIKTVTVSTFPRALSLENDPFPSTLEAAQYSIPFCVAVALARGADALLPLTEAALEDKAVRALAGRVRLVVDPEYKESFPRFAPARVRITDDDGSAAAAVTVPGGDPANPFSLGEIERKFDALAGPRMGDRAAARLKAAVLALGADGDARALSDALRAPLRTVEGQPFEPDAALEASQA